MLVQGLNRLIIQGFICSELLDTVYSIWIIIGIYLVRLL